jgi:uncharacterized membrane protein YphA (DoxX/SURF4 family)
MVWVTFAVGVVAAVLLVLRRREAADTPWPKSPTNWLGLVARIGLGGILLWAGLAKVGDLAGSVVLTGKYQILPTYGLVKFVGYALPIAELLLGALILCGIFTRWTALLGGLLMLVYVPAIASLWVRGIWMDCGCGGAAEAALSEAEAKPRYLLDMIRDLVLAALAAWLVLFPQSRPSVDRWLAAPLEAGVTPAPAPAPAKPNHKSQAKSKKK